MLYVDPCTVVQFMAYFCVPNYVPCEYFSDIRTVSHSDLSCVLCPPVRHALHEQIPGSLGLVSNSPLKMENALQAMER